MASWPSLKMSARTSSASPDLALHGVAAAVQLRGSTSSITMLPAGVDPAGHGSPRARFAEAGCLRGRKPRARRARRLITRGAPLACQRPHAAPRSSESCGVRGSSCSSSLYALARPLALLYLRFLPPLTTAVQAAEASWRRCCRARSTRSATTSCRGSEIADDAGARGGRRGGPALLPAPAASTWQELGNAVCGRAASAGSGSAGASTISQQLVKNLFLTTKGSLRAEGRSR